MSRHVDERDQFLALLDQEIERRRHAELVAVGSDPRQCVIQTLAEMGQRMQASPEWREPSPAKQRGSTRAIEAWFKRNGYL